MKYLEFETLKEAQAALDEINSDPRYPINAEDGGKIYTTLRWTRKIIECTDGKFRFRPPSDEWWLETSLEAKSEFDEKYSSVYVEYDSAWMPEGDE